MYSGSSLHNQAKHCVPALSKLYTPDPLLLLVLPLFCGSVASEDPELTGELSAKFLQGAQGATMEGVPEQKELLTVACCKHIAGYDLENFEVGTPPNNGVVDRVRFDANITSRNLWEFYLPAFETCLKDGKAGSVMCSFNSINGVPSW